LELNLEILDDAENHIRSGRMQLVNYKISPFMTSPRTINTGLDQETIQSILNNKSDYLNGYPRLRGLCEKINNEGGIAVYIQKHFGEMYLLQEMWKLRQDQYLEGSDLLPERVRLYYPDLNDSKMNLKEQFLLLSRLYSNEDQTGFIFTGMKKIDEGKFQALPVTEAMLRRINKRKLQAAIGSRLDGIGLTGTYEVQFDTGIKETEASLAEKVNPLLRVLGIDAEKFWREGSPKLSRKLGRILDTRNPIFSRLDYDKNGVVEVRISNEPMDIMQASTEKPWTSCVNLKGGVNADKLYVDVKAGTEIAYLMRDGKPVGRCLLRGVKTSDGANGVFIEKFYGDGRFSRVLTQTLTEVAKTKGLRVNEKSCTDTRYKGVNTDLGSVGRSGRIYYEYSYDEAMGAEKKMTMAARLVRGIEHMMHTKRVESSMGNY
jgi:hypothetical protein